MFFNVFFKVLLLSTELVIIICYWFRMLVVRSQYCLCFAIKFLLVDGDFFSMDDFYSETAARSVDFVLTAASNEENMVKGCNVVLKCSKKMMLFFAAVKQPADNCEFEIRHAADPCC